MSKTVREVCPHGLHDSHCTGGYEWHQEQRECEAGDKGDLECEWCPGGREIKLRRVEPPLYTDTEIVWFEHSEPNDAIVWVEVTD